MKKNKAMEFAATWSGLTTTELSHYSPTVGLAGTKRTVKNLLVTLSGARLNTQFLEQQSG